VTEVLDYSMEARYPDCAIAQRWELAARREKGIAAGDQGPSGGILC